MAVIRVVDVETTGLSREQGHAVCEIGYCDLVSTSANVLGDPTGWQVAGGFGCLIDPGRPIAPEASAAHHIVDEDVAGQSAWSDAVRILEGYGAEGEIVAFAAHAADFERQWCGEHVRAPWVCTYKAALRLWTTAPQHSNQALRYWRKPFGLDRQEASPPHRAYPDAYVTAHLLRELLNNGANLPDLIAWTDQPALQVTCWLGKWRGTPWREVDDGFLEWVLQPGKDFDEDVLFTARHELERRNAADHEPQGEDIP